MSDVLDLLLHAGLIGTGATLLIDVWAVLRRRWFGIPAPDYGLVGRWFGHLARGRFRHDRIAASPAIAHERLIGWAAHYAIGIVFAALLLALCGPGWVRDPRPGPALALGVATVAAPFFLMQPGMGAGIAASRTPRPTAARVHSVITHAIFGLGLFAAAWGVKLLGG